VSGLGYDPVAIISGASINQVLYADPEFAVPTLMFSRLFAHCARATACQQFGLLVGAEGTLSWLGPIGFMALNAPDVVTALKTIGTYFAAHDRSAAVALKPQGDLISLSYTPLIVMEGQDQWLSGVMSSGVSFLRELCGTSWAPAAVTFAIRHPANTRLHDDFFRARLSFNAAENAILFDPVWLGHKISRAEPELFELLRKEVERQKGAESVDAGLELLRMVRALVGTGQCSSKTVSGLLGIPIRTLYDRLSKQGKTFQGVVDDIRFETAKQLMRNTDMALHDISDRLDYSEISAFTRAFHRWSGTSPGKWRSNRAGKTQ
jgi:AraC-like DNA-binding protein